MILIVFPFHIRFGSPLFSGFTFERFWHAGRTAGGSKVHQPRYAGLLDIFSSSSSSSLLSSLELRDTTVREPQIRGLLGTASHSATSDRNGPRFSKKTPCEWTFEITRPWSPAWAEPWSARI